jgi:hypothetical protein
VLALIVLPARTRERAEKRAFAMQAEPARA